MPMHDMQRDQVFKWFEQKNVKPTCPVCGQDERWETGDIIAPPAQPDGGGTAVGGPNFPLAQLICPHCAYVLHFATPRMRVSMGNEAAQQPTGVGSGRYD